MPPTGNYFNLLDCHPVLYHGCVRSLDFQTQIYHFNDRSETNKNNFSRGPTIDEDDAICGHTQRSVECRWCAEHACDIVLVRTPFAGK